MKKLTGTGYYGCDACNSYITTNATVWIKPAKCPHCGSKRVRELSEGELK